MGVRERRSSPRARVVHTPLQMTSELHREIRNWRAERENRTP